MSCLWVVTGGQRVRGRQGAMTRWSTKALRAGKLFCGIVKWWRHAIVHLSKPQKNTYNAKSESQWNL